MVPPDSNRISRVPLYSSCVPTQITNFAYGAFTLFDWTSQTILLICDFLTARGVSIPLQYALTTPEMQRIDAYTSLVWALPRSLAATRGISFDFYSCRYLDGSVPCVCLPYSIYSCTDTSNLCQWVTPFGYPRITGYWLLPPAFRS